MSHYDVGGHDVSIWERRSRWTAAVDRIPVPGWFVTEADAWSAGVGEAFRRERDGKGKKEGRPG